MDKDILKAWDKNQKRVREWIAETSDKDFSYESLLRATLQILFTDNDRNLPDYRKITVVDNGDYQGTRIFVIGANTYQPSISKHWYTSVQYGSCSACVTIEAIRGYDNRPPTDEQVQSYWMLCLHMVQKMKRMNEDA